MTTVSQFDVKSETSIQLTVVIALKTKSSSIAQVSSSESSFFFKENDCLNNEIHKNKKTKNKLFDKPHRKIKNNYTLYILTLECNFFLNSKGRK